MEPLTVSQKAVLERSRSLGAGGQGVALSDEACCFIIATIARDMGLQSQFPEIPPELPDFFGSKTLASLVVPRVDLLAWFQRLVNLNRDADTYFACLANLHKARLKYERILQTQPIPTFEQVGPRGLLQFGTLSAKALTALLFWRKWFFDIDNRAAQETGYLFEPIIAAAIGGTPAPASRSPVKRRRNRAQGRQVDCICGKRAYEVKLRVTIAASGQGRWREELEFPADCRKSGYKPVLVVLDGTENPKLDELKRAFLKQDGEAFIGDSAWAHLDDMAGHTMTVFLEKYVRRPINSLSKEATGKLTKLSLSMSNNSILLKVANEKLTIHRSPEAEEASPPDVIPDDAAEEI